MRRMRRTLSTGARVTAQIPSTTTTAKVVDPMTTSRANSGRVSVRRRLVIHHTIPRPPAIPTAVDQGSANDEVLDGPNANIVACSRARGMAPADRLGSSDPQLGGLNLPG